MKTVAALVSVVVCLFVCVFGDEKYTTKFDNIDIDKILQNERLLISWHKCLMTGIGCTPEGDTLRKLLPDALETGCSKCSEPQKALGSKALSYLKKEKPEMWEELMDKFDTEKKYRTKYADKLKELD